MAIATATAIGIAAAASAGASVASSKMASNASKKAAGMQQQSANSALDLQRNIYNQQMQMQSPWVSMGQQSAMTLGRLMGVPQGSQFAAGPMQPPMGMQPIGMQGPQAYGMGSGGGGVPQQQTAGQMLQMFPGVWQGSGASQMPPNMTGLQRPMALSNFASLGMPQQMR